MTINMERVERLAGAVDDVTDDFGLNCGEALFAFTTMIKITLDSTSEPAVRARLRKAVADAILADSLTPLVQVIEGRRKAS